MIQFPVGMTKSVILDDICIDKSEILPAILDDGLVDAKLMPYIISFISHYIVSKTYTRSIAESE